MDSALLCQIDSDPEVLQKGRSAFIRSAVELYLKAKERREIEMRLSQAYSGKIDSLLEEIEVLMGQQSWPTVYRRQIVLRSPTARARRAAFR